MEGGSGERQSKLLCSTWSSFPTQQGLLSPKLNRVFSSGHLPWEVVKGHEARSILFPILSGFFFNSFENSENGEHCFEKINCKKKKKKCEKKNLKKKWTKTKIVFSCNCSQPFSCPSPCGARVKASTILILSTYRTNQTWTRN